MKKTTILITIILTSGLLLAQNVPNINLKNLNGKSINIQKLSKSKNIKVLAFGLLGVFHALMNWMLLAKYTKIGKTKLM